MSSAYIHTADPMAPTSSTSTAAANLAASITQQRANVSTTGTATNAPNGHQPSESKSSGAKNATGLAQNASSSTFSSAPSGGLTSFAHFPVSAQEILKRASENTMISAGSPAWEAAREQVLKNMIISNHTLAPLSSSRGKGGRARGGAAASSAQKVLPAQVPATSTLNGDIPVSAPVVAAPPAPTVAATAATIAPPAATHTPMKRGRGRPRGAGARGGKKGRAGRGRKRKRDDDEDTDESPSEPEASDSSDSNEYTPLTTITKSGRSVTKPVQFNPVAEASPDAETKRRRSYRRGPEFQLCAKCQRGHSPLSNVIVFCDGCNAAYHQWCHDPHIPREVVDVQEKEWFCGKCLHKREMESLPLEKRVSGDWMTADEKRAYLSKLSIPTLVSLLLHASNLHPSLPVFASPSPTSTSHVPSKANPPRTNGTLSQPDASSTTATNTAALPTQTPGVPSTLPLSPDSDPYPDYSNAAADPPATYPRPGHGPIKLRPLTDPDDIQWMLDDNAEVFSHLIDDGNGNLVPVNSHRADEWTGDASAMHESEQDVGQEEFEDAAEEVEVDVEDVVAGSNAMEVEHATEANDSGLGKAVQDENGDGDGDGDGFDIDIDDDDDVAVVDMDEDMKMGYIVP